MKLNDILNTLRSCIDSSKTREDDQAEETPSSLSANKFFTHWFLENSQPYYFLFSQNFRVTNLQGAEFLALARMHSRCAEITNESLIVPEFVRSSVFKDGLADLVAQISAPATLDSQRFRKRIWSYVRNKVVVDFYYGSVGLFRPSHIDFDLGDMCGESGYIHSCGKLVLLRNAAKLNESGIRSRFDRYLAANPDGRVFLIPYCHEDFSGKDRHAQFLSRGLDEVKLYLTKSSVGSTSLMETLEKLRAGTLCGDKFDIAGPEDYSADKHADKPSQHDNRRAELSAKVGDGVSG